MNELAQVTPAYATPFDCDEGFVFAWIWGWYIDHTDVALAKELGCFHDGGACPDRWAEWGVGVTNKRQEARS
jgi:hypothetical protein